MVTRTGPSEYEIILNFGGGLHTRAPENKIMEGEAADGRNFLLDIQNTDLKPRQPYDLVATAANAGAIRGGGSYRKNDGTVIAWFQAGDTVYEYDSNGLVGSPVLDTVSSSARLRGHWRSHAWNLDDKTLISDLELTEPVMEWDGTTWQDVSFRSSPSTAFGSTFYCKYIAISSERAWYSHIKQDSTTSGHIIVGSETSDYEQISSTNKPSSGLGNADPFFMVSPDLRNINGYVEAFGTRVLSTEFGRLFRLAGNDATDFNFVEFYPNSYCAGEESLSFTGNDIMYGRQGRIESVRDTDRYGDTAADDLSKDIYDQIQNYTGWTTVYNARLNRVYFFPDNVSEVWVYDTAFPGSGSEASPWMKWKTSHSLGFDPTFVSSMLDPADGLEYVFMGDNSGNIYRLEGSGTSGDAGSEPIVTQWTSKLYTLPTSQKIFDIEGYIRYRKNLAVDVTIELQYAGENLFNESIQVSIPAADNSSQKVYYGNSQYYGNQEYYGSSFQARLTRNTFEMPGIDTNEFQVSVSVTDADTFEINEIGLRFRGQE